MSTEVETSRINKADRSLDDAQDDNLDEILTTSLRYAQDDIYMDEILRLRYATLRMTF